MFPHTVHLPRHWTLRFGSGRVILNNRDRERSQPGTPVIFGHDFHIFLITTLWEQILSTRHEQMSR